MKEGFTIRVRIFHHDANTAFSYARKLRDSSARDENEDSPNEDTKIEDFEQSRSLSITTGVSLSIARTERAKIFVLTVLYDSRREVSRAAYRTLAAR